MNSFCGKVADVGLINIPDGPSRVINPRDSLAVGTSTTGSRLTSFDSGIGSGPAIPLAVPNTPTTVVATKSLDWLKMLHIARYNNIVACFIHGTLMSMPIFREGLIQACLRVARVSRRCGESHGSADFARLVERAIKHCDYRSNLCVVESRALNQFCIAPYCLQHAYGSFVLQIASNLLHLAEGVGLTAHSREKRSIYPLSQRIPAPG